MVKLELAELADKRASADGETSARFPALTELRPSLQLHVSFSTISGLSIS